MSQPYPLTEATAAQLRSAPTLERWRQQAKVVSQTALLPGSPAELWPVCAMTDFLNQAVGLQTTQNTYLNRDYGGTWMHAETKNAGLPVAYEELPYEWEAPHRYRVERIHSKGPLKYLSFGVDLEAVSPEQTQVCCQIHFVSILPTPAARLLINKEISRFMQEFQRLAATLQKGTPALNAFFDLAPKLQSQIESWSERWQTLGIQAPVARALAEYIARAPERLAYRLRPFELAAAYALDPLEVLQACLLLSRENLLHLMWDCRCPGCKGPKESFHALTEIKAMAFCPTCAVTYGLAFDQNLELTFQPDRGLRPTTEQYFCAGGPGNTPHIAWQQNLLPQETRSFELRLNPGAYVLHSLSLNNEWVLLIEEDNHALSELSPELSLELGELIQISDQTATEPLPEALLVKAGTSLTLHNRNTHELTVMLENLDWQSQAVTAARVQAVQAFHDLFPEQVLAPGEALPLQSQILLQVLLNQTHPEVTPQEIAAWLQTRIQQHQGALISEGSDRWLGVFATAYEALAAAWDLQQELPELNLLYTTPLVLGMAIASGPCEVSAQNQQLGYRGGICETVQAAASEAPSQSIVVAESLLQTPEMQDFLHHPQATWTTHSESWIRFDLQPTSEEGDFDW